MTRKDRTILKAYLDRYTDYDPASLRVASNGHITAKLDADKTNDAPETERYLVGYLAELLPHARNVHSLETTGKPNDRS